MIKINEEQLSITEQMMGIICYECEHMNNPPDNVWCKGCSYPDFVNFHQEGF